MQTTHSCLSERVRRLQPSSTLAVSARVRALREEGRDVIGFGAGEPDFETPDHIKAAAIEALQRGCTRYAPVAGEPPAREAIAEKLRRENGIACEPTDIVITVGGKHALFMIFQCLLDPGREQEVILPTPAWVSYRPMIELAGGRVVEVPGAVENDFRVEPDQIERAISDRTVAIVINSPSNPCGTMYEPEELRALAEVVEPHGQITILTDEIYEKLVFGDAEHLSLGSLPALADRVVTVNGLSKAYAMTGWRIGYACGPGGIAAAMTKLQGQMTSNITSFCYAAIVRAIEHGEPDVVRMRDQFAARAARIHERLTAMPGIRCPRPTGAFYVFPDVRAWFHRRSPGGREIDSSLAFAEALLEEADVAVVPGGDFGECGEGHVRMGFAISVDLIEQGCDRLAGWLARFPEA